MLLTGSGFDGRKASGLEGRVPRANPAARGQIYTPKRARAVAVRRRRGPGLVQIVVMGGDIGPAAEPVNPGIWGGEMQKGRPERRPSVMKPAVAAMKPTVAGMKPAVAGQPFGSHAIGTRR